MSIKTFLSHLWDAISSIFQHAETEIKTILLPVAINVVDAFKTITQADQGNYIGHLAGSAGAVVEDKLRQLLPPLLTELKLVQASPATDVNILLKQAFDNLELSTDRAKNAFYHSLASMLLNDLADGKITWSEAVELCEYYYKNKPAIAAV